LTDNEPNNFVEIGFLKKPFGISGHLNMHQHSPDAGSIFKVSKIWIDSKFFYLEEVKNGASNPIIKLIKIDTREEASKLSKKKVFITESDLPEAPKGKFYQSELLGLSITNNGEEVGTLREILETGGNDVYVISLNTGKELLVPNVPDFINKIDIKNNTIDIIMPEVI